MLALAGMAVAGPALAQDMAHMGGMMMPGMAMPGVAMKMPAKPAASKPIAPARKPHATPAAHDHAMGMAMPGMQSPGDAPPAQQPAIPDHAMQGMNMGGMAGVDRGTLPAGTALAPGNAPPPPPPTRFYADREYAPAAMARARQRMMTEQGGQTLYQLLFNLAEYQARAGRDGFRWDGEAWIGGDIDRLAIRTEGEGSTRAQVDSAEIQALWSHAIGRYANLQGRAAPGPRQRAEAHLPRPPASRR